MIVEKRINTPQHIDVTMFKGNTKVRIVYQAKNKALIDTIEILTSSVDTLPDVSQSIVTLGAATYKRVSTNDYETHVKKAVAHILREDSDIYAVIRRDKLDKLVRHYEIEH